jgi:hypothetical protein
MVSQEEEAVVIKVLVGKVDGWWVGLLGVGVLS